MYVNILTLEKGEIASFFIIIIMSKAYNKENFF